MVHRIKGVHAVRWLLVLLGVLIPLALHATPGDAAGGSKTSCNPAPYHMFRGGGGFDSSHRGMGGIRFRTIHHSTQPQDKEKYRVSWYVNDGYVICRVKQLYVDGSAKNLPTGKTSGHWDYEAYLGTSTHMKGTEVWVRKAR